MNINALFREIRLSVLVTAICLPVGIAHADGASGDPPAWVFNVPVEMSHLHLGSGISPREDNYKISKIFVLCEVGRGQPLPSYIDAGNNNRIYYSGWSGTTNISSSTFSAIDLESFNTRALLGTGKAEIAVVNGTVDTTATVQVWPLNPDVQPGEATNYACHFRLGVNYYRHIRSGNYANSIEESGPDRNSWISTAHLRGAPFTPNVSGAL